MFLRVGKNPVFCNTLTIERAKERKYKYGKLASMLAMVCWTVWKFGSMWKMGERMQMFRKVTSNHRSM